MCQWEEPFSAIPIHAQEDLTFPYVFPDGNPSELLTASLYQATTTPWSSQTHLSTNTAWPFHLFPHCSNKAQRVLLYMHAYVHRDISTPRAIPKLKDVHLPHLGSSKLEVRATSQAANPQPPLICTPSTGCWGRALLGHHKSGFQALLTHSRFTFSCLLIISYWKWQRRASAPNAPITAVIITGIELMFFINIHAHDLEINFPLTLFFITKPNHLDAHSKVENNGGI